jgi:hypothetical protein
MLKRLPTIWEDCRSRFAWPVPTSAADADQSRQVITRAWELSLDLLDRRGMPQARPLLELLCQLAEAPIPYQLVLHPETIGASELFVGVDAIQLWKLLRALAHLEPAR